MSFVMFLSDEWPGISGYVLVWFTSYMSNRSQSFSVEGVLSDAFKLNFRNSSCKAAVLIGPLVFIL